MKRSKFAFLFCLILIATPLFSYPNRAIAGGNAYVYYSGGEKVELTPDPDLVIVQPAPGHKGIGGQTLKEIGAAPDPLNDNPVLRRHGLRLYRRNNGANREKSLKSLLEKAAGDDSLIVQPVFAQGQALLIPTAEIMVGVKPPTTTSDLAQKLETRRRKLGIATIKKLDDHTLLVTITRPGNGRCYQVCQRLGRTDGIAYAEPNHLVVMLYEETKSLLDKTLPQPPDFNHLPALVPTVTSRAATPPAATANGWVVLAHLDGEGGKLPSGWGMRCAPNTPRCGWGPTGFKALRGQGSLYCAAAGPTAVNPPGPAPNGMKAYLVSPNFDFSPYDTVFIEAWFFARNELTTDANGKPNLEDGAFVYVTDGKKSAMKALAVPFTGDCTRDPTTKNGWRKCLFRVPEKLLKNRVKIAFIYISDRTNPSEGCYLDEITIRARPKGKQTAAISRDPYSTREYELSNHGQVAGLGGPGHDLAVAEAWRQVKVSPQIIVAVLDDGVDLQHPDLNLVPGYRPDGSPGGGPESKNDNHGTAVAGNIGAIGNNNLGVVGVAPGVKIMPINGGGSILERARAIRLAADRGARIINNSWGWIGVPSNQIAAAIGYALNKGVVVLFAAGNGPDRKPWSYEVAFPGRLTEKCDLICVGACGPGDDYKGAASSDGQFGWGSSYIGPGPDVCAPGPWSWTCDRRGRDGYNDGSQGIDADYCNDFTGTSSACPKVAGVVALMLSANPNLTPSEVKKILKESADDIDRQGFDDRTGAGRVNAGRAVKLALAAAGNSGPISKPQPRPQPTPKPKPRPQPKPTPPPPAPKPKPRPPVPPDQRQPHDAFEQPTGDGQPPAASSGSGGGWKNVIE